MDTKRKQDAPGLGLELTEDERQEIYESVRHSLIRDEIETFIKQYEDKQYMFRDIYWCDYDEALGKIDEIQSALESMMKEKDLYIQEAMRKVFHDSIHALYLYEAL